ncbi:MAG: cytochrome c biogenesis protein CcdA [Pseudomonadota bacterium]
MTFLTAFLAGLLSFVSPCVLPLVPAYLCYLAGSSFEDMTEGVTDRKLRRDVLIASLFFVLGFSLVFILLGASASAAGQLLRGYQDILSKIAGAAILVFGLHFLGALRLPFLNIEKRFSFPNGAGPGSAFLMGLAFAFGWTPCIGPVLAAILAVAARGESLVQGMLLLTSYALGLGVPFLLAGAALPLFLRVSKRVRRSIGWFEKIAGLGLVLTGLLLLFDKFTMLAGWLIEAFPALAALG